MHLIAHSMLSLNVRMNPWSVFLQLPGSESYAPLRPSFNAPSNPVAHYRNSLVPKFPAAQKGENAANFA